MSSTIYGLGPGPRERLGGFGLFEISNESDGQFAIFLRPPDSPHTRKTQPLAPKFENQNPSLSYGLANWRRPSCQNHQPLSQHPRPLHCPPSRHRHYPAPLRTCTKTRSTLTPGGSYKNSAVQASESSLRRSQRTLSRTSRSPHRPFQIIALIRYL